MRITECLIENVSPIFQQCGAFHLVISPQIGIFHEIIILKKVLNGAFSEHEINFLQSLRT